MKEKHCNFLINLMLCITIMQTLIFSFNTCVFTNCIIAKTPVWAQIKNSNTYLYKSAEFNKNIDNVWCLIENSYFVKIINNYNTEVYKVEYNGITGFVKKNEISLINETPKTPYPNNITFSIGSTNCYMRTRPQIKDYTDNIVCVIPANTSGLKFIGKTIGEEAVDFKGSIWYLTEYNGQLGYVYSDYTTSINPIKENVEQVSLFVGNDFSKINPLTNTTCVFLIVLTLLPCMAIMFILYHPKKGKIKHKRKVKQNYKNYYEENL